MFMHVFQTKVWSVHRADQLFQMKKQAHLVDFTPCLHEYAKEGIFATVCQIQAEQNANGTMQCTLSVLKTVVVAMIAAAA